MIKNNLNMIKLNMKVKNFGKYLKSKMISWK